MKRASISTQSIKEQPVFENRIQKQKLGINNPPEKDAQQKIFGLSKNSGIV